MYVYFAYNHLLLNYKCREAIGGNNGREGERKCGANELGGFLSVYNYVQ